VIPLKLASAKLLGWAMAAIGALIAFLSVYRSGKQAARADANQAAADAGCGTTVQTVCPPLVEYDQPFMNRLADELSAAPADSAMTRAVVDYRRLRDVVRACNPGRR
jgi:hypothetical protein